jgi:beta-lactamase class A
MRASAALCAALAVIALAGAAGAIDSAPLTATPATPATPAAPAAPATPGGYETFEDPILRQLHALDRIAPFEDAAPLWDWNDAELLLKVGAAIDKLALRDAVRQQKLAVVLVDISDLKKPKVAAVNGDVMLYAASLPKIAVLLAAFEKIAEGKLKLDKEFERQLVAMIRVSSNSAATAVMQQVGKDYIARVLLSPRYRLYDPRRNGGLWVGKEYAKTGIWRRDPLHNLSHGATAMQVARFYYMMQTGRLVTPEYSAKMKKILANPGLYHKFVGALQMVNPAAAVFRKSGTWKTHHSDSVLVERGRRAYIAVAMADSPDGDRWLGQIIVSLDEIVFGRSWLHRVTNLRR